MKERQQKAPAVRRSLGPGYTNMICPGCGEGALHGLIDVNGRPYVSCEGCRFRALGMSLRAVASVRFLGRLLMSAPVREAWAKEVVAAMGDALMPPSTAAPTPVPVNDLNDVKGASRGSAA